MLARARRNISHESLARIIDPDNAQVQALLEDQQPPDPALDIRTHWAP